MIPIDLGPEKGYRSLLIVAAIGYLVLTLVADPHRQQPKKQFSQTVV